MAHSVRPTMMLSVSTSETNERNLLRVATAIRYDGLARVVAGWLGPGETFRRRTNVVNRRALREQSMPQQRTHPWTGGKSFISQGKSVWGFRYCGQLCLPPSRQLSTVTGLGVSCGGGCPTAECKPRSPAAFIQSVRPLDPHWRFDFNLPAARRAVLLESCCPPPVSAMRDFISLAERPGGRSRKADSKKDPNAPIRSDRSGKLCKRGWPTGKASRTWKRRPRGGLESFRPFLPPW
jgi:hypothetical protein